MSTHSLMLKMSNTDNASALKMLETFDFNFKYVYSNRTLLITAIMFKREQIALAIIANGESDFGFVDDLGVTALMYACILNMSEVALALIATGKSNPSQISFTNHNTALIRCCRNKMNDVALALIATDQSKPDHVNKANKTAFDFVCDNEMYDVMLEMFRREIINLHDLIAKKSEWIDATMFAQTREVLEIDV